MSGQCNDQSEANIRIFVGDIYVAIMSKDGPAVTFYQIRDLRLDK